MITTIIFDYSGVLTDGGVLQPFFDDCEKQYGKLMRDLGDKGRLVWDEARIGKISSAEYWKLLAGHFGADEKDLLEKCLEIDAFSPEMYEFIKSLKGKYVLGLITNQLEDWFETADRRHHIRELFNETITSYESGFAKPDLEIYKYALKRLNVNPEDCIYIDDMEKNVQAAEAIDMRGIVFKNLQQLKLELEKLAIR